MPIHDGLKDLVQKVVENTLGDNADDLHAVIKETDMAIQLSFVRWCGVVKDYRKVGPVEDDMTGTSGPKHLSEAWSKKHQAPKIAQEASALASKAYQSHMEWQREANERGIA